MSDRCPVLVLPGWGGGDRSTIGLRSQLRLAGHPTHRWRQGTNSGNFPDIFPGLATRFLELADRHERPVALVGWSLGGVYACHLADQFGRSVRQVVTLGSPLRSMGVFPPATIPLTSIWSRNDRVVPWQRASVEPGGVRENIEVRSTHLTLGFDPLVIGAVIDRLAQDPADWQPFRPPAMLRGLYPVRRAQG